MASLKGEPVGESEDTVRELPLNFKQWMEDNEERLGRAKSVPYFIKDNPQYMGVTPRMAGMEGFEGAKLGRTATKAAMQEYAGCTPTVLTSELQANVREAAAMFGTTATPMTFVEANEGRANIDFTRGRAFKDNCQACVLIHEARLRGLNVTAIGYDPTEGSWSKLLGDNPSLGFLRQDGSVPQHALLRADSADLLRSKLEKQTKWTGRYHIGVNLHGDIGHIITAERLQNGKLLFYDAQNGAFLKLEEYSAIESLEVLKVDKLLLNKEALKAIARLI